MGRPTRWRGDQPAAYWLGVSVSQKPCGIETYLIDTLVVERLAVGDVLPANGVVHVGLDAAGSDRVDGNLLVTKVLVVLVEGSHSSCL